MSDVVELVPCVKADLFDIFGFYVTAKKIKDGIELDCGESCTMTFMRLKRLSEIFNTDRIDVNSEIISGGYCETCSYESTSIRVQILKPLPEDNQ